MRLAHALVPSLLATAFAFFTPSCSSSSSSSNVGTDSGPTGDGGCLLTTPTKGAPCSGSEVLCDPGNLCCGGEWRCDPSSHTWNLLQGGCACGDAAPPLDTGTGGGDTGNDSTGDVVDVGG